MVCWRLGVYPSLRLQPDAHGDKPFAHLQQQVSAALGWLYRAWDLRFRWGSGRYFYAMPYGHLRLNFQLPFQLGDRNAMVTVAHKVGILDLHQFDGRQGDITATGDRDTDPAILVVTLQRPKVGVEIVTAPLTASNLGQRDRLDAGIVAALHLDLLAKRG